MAGMSENQTKLNQTKPTWIYVQMQVYMCMSLNISKFLEYS